jgi:hypothetical protein
MYCKGTIFVKRKVLFYVEYTVDGMCIVEKVET